MKYQRFSFWQLLGSAWLTSLAVGAAGPLSVPNASFETPSLLNISVAVGSWEKVAKPAWYDESGPFLWSQLIGIFDNTPVGEEDHLDNCDGAQALWLFAVPEVALFQDYDTIGSGQSVPSHEFDVKYEIGKAYHCTVGINGGGGGMLTGATLELILYYRNAQGDHVTVAQTTVRHSIEAFPNHTHFFDYQVSTPPVKPTDPWAGKNLGIKFLSTVTPQLEGGYWDLDHVRLSSSIPAPTLDLARLGPEVRLSWVASAEATYRIQSGTTFGVWDPPGPVIPGTAGVLFQDFPLSGATRRFFRVLTITP